MTHQEVDRGTVSAKVNGRDIHWDVVGAKPSHLGDATLALGLMPAMQQGLDLEVGLGVSQRLLHQTGAIQELLSSWDPSMKRVKIVASPSRDSGESPSGTGLFFSGGVDSFYSLVTHRGEITHLVTINGLDNFDDTRLTEMCHTVAARERLTPVVVRTNARVAVKELDWLTFGHGAVLASVGLLLQKELGRLFVASSSRPAYLKPMGTHPDLDPLWSTETLEFVHDAMLSRTEKLRRISDDPVAMSSLKVCWRHPQRYNCGECEKCLRTMIMLDLCGRLDRCATLPSPLSLGKISRACLPSRGVVRWQRLVVEAEDAGRADLVWALRSAILRNQVKNSVRARLGDVRKSIRGVGSRS